MDKTTKELRAQLRELYERHRADLESQVEWIEVHGIQPLHAEQESASALARLTDAERIGFLCQSLTLPRALKRMRGYGDPAETFAEDISSDEWVVAWPNGHTFPHDLRSAFTLMQLVIPVLEAWIDHLSDDAPSADGLIPEARLFLKAMLDLGFHDGERGNQDDIWERVGEIDEEKRGRKARVAALKLLKDRKLVDSLSGTGTTLTDAGLKLARSLK
jgi:hypothetical protein